MRIITYYRWDDINRRQTDGAAMDLRAFGSLSRSTMDEWLEKFRSKLDEIGIKVTLIKKYKDDVTVIAHNLPLGTRSIGGNLVQTDELR